MRDATLIIVIFLATVILIVAIAEYIFIRNAIQKDGKVQVVEPSQWDFSRILAGLKLTYQGMGGYG